MKREAAFSQKILIVEEILTLGRKLSIIMLLTITWVVAATIRWFKLV